MTSSASSHLCSSQRCSCPTSSISSGLWLCSPLLGNQEEELMTLRSLPLAPVVAQLWEADPAF